MSLKYKLSLILLLVFLCYGVTNFAIQQLMILPGFLSLEQDEVTKDSQRIVSSLRNEIDHLDALCHDWSAWDNTYEYVETRSGDYVDANLVPSSFTDNALNLIHLYDTDGRVVWGEVRDLASEEEIEVKEFKDNILSRKHPLITYQTGTGSLSETKVSGIFMTDQGPMLISSRPILNSHNEGPIRGSLVMGRFLDTDAVAMLIEQIHIDFRVFVNQPDQLPEELKQISGFIDPGKHFLQIVDDKHLKAYAALPDILGNTALLIESNHARKIVEKGRSINRLATYSVLAAGFGVIIIVLLVINLTVLKPIIRLKDHILSIKQTDDLSSRLKFRRRDEIGTLAKEFDGMLGRLSQARKSLMESEKRLRNQNNVMMELSKIQLDEIDDLDAVLMKITETVAHTLSVERVSVWLYNEEHSKIKCVKLYESNKKKHSAGMELSSMDSPCYFKLLKEKRTIAAHDAQTDPSTREFTESYLKPHNITSMLDSPIRMGNRTVGIVGTEHVGPMRVWSLDEQAFVSSIADLISLAMQAFERKKLESQLKRAEKMEAIGTLAGGVAHDLNNILSGVVSYPELLLMDIPEGSPLRKPVLTIKKSGERAAAIVQDLLTLTRRGVAVTEVMDLNRLISDYLKGHEYNLLKSSHPDVQVEAKLETNPLNIIGSPAHLSKTVMNLVSNAAETMPHGGTVRISTENRYIDKPVKGYDDVNEGDYVVLSVSDTGTGIKTEDMEKIFEPFYTKKEMGRSGTGLEMAVVWGTVKDHKGYIDARSTEGEGTAFNLFIPVTRQELASDQSAPSLDALMGNGEMILVVDDVKVQREIATRMLLKLGYSASSVQSGEEALDFLKNNKVDLVVLDMIMDPGMDGLDTFKQILALYPTQKTIIASGFSESDRVKEAQTLGAGEYIKKPYTLEKIGIAIKTRLSRQEV